MESLVQQIKEYWGKPNSAVVRLGDGATEEETENFVSDLNEDLSLPDDFLEFYKLLNGQNDAPAAEDENNTETKVTHTWPMLGNLITLQPLSGIDLYMVEDDMEELKQEIEQEYPTDDEDEGSEEEEEEEEKPKPKGKGGSGLKGRGRNTGKKRKNTKASPKAKKQKIEESIFWKKYKVLGAVPFSCADFTEESYGFCLGIFKEKSTDEFVYEVLYYNLQDMCNMVPFGIGIENYLKLEGTELESRYMTLANPSKQRFTQWLSAYVHKLTTSGIAQKEEDAEKIGICRHTEEEIRKWDINYHFESLPVSVKSARNDVKE